MPLTAGELKQILTTSRDKGVASLFLFREELKENILNSNDVALQRLSMLVMLGLQETPPKYLWYLTDFTLDLLVAKARGKPYEIKESDLVNGEEIFFNYISNLGYIPKLSTIRAHFGSLGFPASSKEYRTAKKLYSEIAAIQKKPLDTRR